MAARTREIIRAWLISAPRGRARGHRKALNNATKVGAFVLAGALLADFLNTEPRISNRLSVLRPA